MFGRPQGTHGSGTVFFGGCNLKCVFCQNWDVSQTRGGWALPADVCTYIHSSVPALAICIICVKWNKRHLNPEISAYTRPSVFFFDRFVEGLNRQEFHCRTIAHCPSCFFYVQELADLLLKLQNETSMRLAAYAARSAGLVMAWSSMQCRRVRAQLEAIRMWIATLFTFLVKRAAFRAIKRNVT